MSKNKRKEKDRPATAAPQASEEAEKLWIYPGERRPVIVKARNERHAKHKVTQSSQFDGFPVYVYPVEDFFKKCFPSGEKEEPKAKEEDFKVNRLRDEKNVFIAFFSSFQSLANPTLVFFDSLAQALDWKRMKFSDEQVRSNYVIRIYELPAPLVWGGMNNVALRGVDTSGPQETLEGRVVSSMNVPPTAGAGQGDGPIVISAMSPMQVLQQSIAQANEAVDEDDLPPEENDENV